MQFSGIYHRLPIENDWHNVKITVTPGHSGPGKAVAQWKNAAGVEWTINIQHNDAGSDYSGVVHATPASDCPYGVDVRLFFTAAHGKVTNMNFYGEYYTRVGELDPQEVRDATLAAELSDVGDRELMVAGYTPEVLSNLGRMALGAVVRITELYQAGDEHSLITARETLQFLWKGHPPGTKCWWASQNNSKSVHFGMPACYYLLRMIDECVNSSLPVGGYSDSRTLNFTIISTQKASVPIVQTIEELRDENKYLGNTTAYIHPKVLPDGRTDADFVTGLCNTIWDGPMSTVYKTALYWFGEYMYAISGGMLRLKVRQHVLPAEFSVETIVAERHATLPNYYAPINALPREIVDASDIFWVVYPSPVPLGPLFDGTGSIPPREFISGGMGAYEGRPVFISDDLSIVRKPYHLGHGLYSAAEVFVYIPQWLQHEYYHALYNTYYPELNLEPTSHSWFDRSTWPSDFEGEMEPDYYHQCLHKRILISGSRLHERLKVATSDY